MFQAKGMQLKHCMRSKKTSAREIKQSITLVSKIIKLEHTQHKSAQQNIIIIFKIAE